MGFVFEFRLTFGLFLVLGRCHKAGSECGLRISEINCNTAVQKNNELFGGEAFVELEHFCHAERKISDGKSRFYDLDKYHLVVWDRSTTASRIVLPLISGTFETSHIGVGPGNFSSQGQFNYTEIYGCPFGMYKGQKVMHHACDQWLPHASSSGKLLVCPA